MGFIVQQGNIECGGDVVELLEYAFGVARRSLL